MSAIIEELVEKISNLTLAEAAELKKLWKKSLELPQQRR